MKELPGQKSIDVRLKQLDIERRMIGLPDRL